MKVESVYDGMISLSAGQIAQRDDRKQTQWTCAIAPFQLCRVPTTQALYLEVMQAAPARFPHPDAPVECVSWLDAVVFCNRLSLLLDLQPVYDLDPLSYTAHWHQQRNGFRLPTDAEWEYACRAHSGEVQYGPLEQIAWYAHNSAERSHPVGLKVANDFGLHDMLGNVWEWCWDLYDAEVYGSYRVFRGGGWSDAPRGCLASNRRRSHPTFCIEDLGFRLARSLPQGA
ncbi:formylglycine-generating enzyme family protein [Pseudomonas sp. Fl4BN1]|uniref:formylglycine-generating enzyme family protein n=1 Tax=Pseudomonas sp. Fl4BN1 TaxID=2697651 RepID=UPI00137817E4|nr:formylglycine-generating enzyme family protein [Pseudomonas sp. Fl4BN1]NBF12145.1 SUMF1/EgtB/PvdO family nonheme iron enzyme [Pseudomonas sp. Fl4BN1]